MRIQQDATAVVVVRNPRGRAWYATGWPTFVSVLTPETADGPVRVRVEMDFAVYGAGWPEVTVRELLRPRGRLAKAKRKRRPEPIPVWYGRTVIP